jgi:hypothetical protein
LTPEQFLLRFVPPIQAIAERLRALVRATVPGSSEQVKLGWKLIGLYVPAKRKPVYFGFILPHEDRLSFGFEHGVLLDDPHRVLLGESEHLSRVRYLSFGGPAQVKRAELVPFIRQAAQLALMPRALRETTRATQRRS